MLGCVGVGVGLGVESAISFFPEKGIHFIKWLALCRGCIGIILLLSRLLKWVHSILLFDYAKFAVALLFSEKDIIKAKKLDNVFG